MKDESDKLDNERLCIFPPVFFCQKGAWGGSNGGKIEESPSDSSGSCGGGIEPVVMYVFRGFEGPSLCQTAFEFLYGDFWGDLCGDLVGETIDRMIAVADRLCLGVFGVGVDIVAMAEGDWLSGRGEVVLGCEAR